jgi:hypothetical protein
LDETVSPASFHVSLFPFHSLSPVQRDGLMGASSDTEVAAVAATGVNEGRLIRVQLNDGFALADSAGQALMTGLTPLIHHMGYGRHLSFGGLY